ncbi:hypothetical protein HPE56_04855 [Maribacter sp. ANRC-HE7]|uniref:SdiA-regulated n=1 Tax=Maribacter aquimaris TaxID=2737171 RepID=A0ABR7UX42_9FLAO|nr:hypothetical protein [Maribacter aquimaris]MBD0777117.1 hypothetical protein [Maribacter aquimaris]
MWKLPITLLSVCLLNSCANYSQLTYVAKLPKKLKENSGMVTLNDSLVWLVEDHGNKNLIYQVDLQGNLLRELKVDNAHNEDWEDLTKDLNQNVFIGDFGNNDNKRKDLTIYKIPNPEIAKGKKIKAEKIKFSYPNQKEFPPSKVEMNFDAEAFFHYNDAFYIISKNRTKPFTGIASIYKVPAKPGTYKAASVGEFFTCKQEGECRVTAADISPDGSTIALLGYGKLWLFSAFELDDFSKGKMKTIDLGISTQLESISFLDNETLLLSDEVRGNSGGNLYSIKISK